MSTSVDNSHERDCVLAYSYLIHTDVQYIVNVLSRFIDYMNKKDMRMQKYTKKGEAVTGRRRDMRDC